MKSNCNFVVCIGGILLIGGGVGTIIFYSSVSNILQSSNQEGLGNYLAGTIVSVIVLLVGLLMIIRQLKYVGNWNKVVGIAKSQNRITMKEMSMKSGVAEAKIGPIIYEAIAAGDLAGTIEGDTFSRSTPSTTSTPSDAKVLVVCRYCGGKTEQGFPKCQKCGADI